MKKTKKLEITYIEEKPDQKNIIMNIFDKLKNLFAYEKRKSNIETTKPDEMEIYITRLTLIYEKEALSQQLNLFYQELLNFRDKISPALKQKYKEKDLIKPKIAYGLMLKSGLDKQDFIKMLEKHPYDSIDKKFRNLMGLSELIIWWSKYESNPKFFIELLVKQSNRYPDIISDYDKNLDPKYGITIPNPDKVIELLKDLKKSSPFKQREMLRFVIEFCSKFEIKTIQDEENAYIRLENIMKKVFG
jgi:hypothetical protein